MRQRAEEEGAAEPVGYLGMYVAAEVGGCSGALLRMVLQPGRVLVQACELAVAVEMCACHCQGSMGTCWCGRGQAVAQDCWWPQPDCCLFAPCGS